MAKFLFLYTGPATAMGSMSEAESKAEIEKWTAWAADIGPGLVDFGNPTSQGISVVDNGSKAQAAAVCGYSIVEAGDISQARDFTEGHPFLSEGKGKFAVEIFEIHEISG